MVIRRKALDSRLASPLDVLLAVEVVSPSSLTEDRLVKSAQYVAAGIQHYWRLERQDAPEFVTHELERLVYREAGRFTDEVVVERPVGLRFRLEHLFR
jgi:Uma2 family endonuclease